MSHDVALAPAPYLDAEKLDCYQPALELNGFVQNLAPRGHGELRDQLRRAALSVVLNCAEGAGRRSPLDKARFFAIARGSATECAAVIDVVRSLGLAPAQRCSEGRWMIVRIVQMLTKLEARCAGRV